MDVHTLTATGDGRASPTNMPRGGGTATMTVERDVDFSAWFDEVLPRVYRLARRTAVSRDEAEDIASEALARAYARWPSIRDLPHRDGWVLRTAANLCTDAARRGARFPWARLRLVHRDERAAGSVEEQVADRRLLAAALSGLPTRQRESVALRYLAGLSLEETAKTMGLGVETVRTHVSRGLASMRSTLGADTLEELDAQD